MVNQEFCQKCSQIDDCQKVYQRLGCTKGPSVAGRAVIAFLLPMLVFIAVLVVYERMLGKGNLKPFQTGFGFLLALLVTAGCMLSIAGIRKQLGKH